MDRRDPVPEGILRLTSFNSFPVTLLRPCGLVVLWSDHRFRASPGFYPGLGILTTDDV